VIHSLTANIGTVCNICNSIVHFFLLGTNVFMLDSNGHYFRSWNLALPQDSHSLRGSSRDLWTVLTPFIMLDHRSVGSSDVLICKTNSASVGVRNLKIMKAETTFFSPAHGMHGTAYILSIGAV
jgi:hypothetical protein